jgi:hypothetical protein
MSLRQSLIFFIGAVLALFVTYMMGQNARKSYMQEQSTLEAFEKDARSLAGLKSKFSDKENIDRAIKTLKRIAPTSKDFKKSDARVLLFENLDAGKLGSLIRKVENGTLNLKKFEIIRQSNESASLRLEIK